MEGENELDSDDDIGWDDLPDNEPPIKEPPQPPSTEAPANQPTEVMTEQQLMQLSNAALKDLLKKEGLTRNISKVLILYLQTKMLGHTLLCFNMIFARCTFVLNASSPSTQSPMLKA